MFTQKNRGSVGLYALLVTLIVTVVIATTAIISQQNRIPEELLGGTSNTNSALKITPPGSLSVGTTTSATAFTFIKKGTCNLVGGTIAATSTGFAACAVTGALAGDLVFATFATSSPGAAIVGAQASSTAGYITLKILNLSGASRDTTAFGTGTAYLIVR